MGCHRRLGYARLLNRSGFGFVTVFVIHVRQSLSSLQRPEPEKGFSVCFRSVQPLPNSHNKSSFVQHTNPSRSTCFHICFTPFQSFRYALFPQPHQQPTLAVGITPHNLYRSTVQPTASSSYPIQRQQKHVAPASHGLGMGRAVTDKKEAGHGRSGT